MPARAAPRRSTTQTSASRRPARPASIGSPAVTNDHPAPVPRSTGYNIDLSADIDWANAVPTSGMSFPMNQPPPRELTEEERAIEELREMNSKCGFIFTLPIPDDIIPPPRPRPTPRRQSEPALPPQRTPPPQRAPLQQELASAPRPVPGQLPRRRITGNSIQGKRAPSQLPAQSPQIGPGSMWRSETSPQLRGAECEPCPYCSTPSTRFCSATGLRHHQSLPATPPSASLRRDDSASRTPPQEGTPSRRSPSSPSPVSGHTPQRSPQQLGLRQSPALLQGPSAVVDELLAVQEAEVAVEEEIIRAILLETAAQGPATSSSSSSSSSSSPTPASPPPAPEPRRAENAREESPPASPPTSSQPPVTATPRGGAGGRRSTASTAPFATSETPARTPRRGRGRGQVGEGEWEINDFSYERLLDLGSMAVSTGLGKAQLASFRPIPYEGPPQGCEAEDCTICLETLQRGDRSLRIVCRHAFHHQCIIEWLAKTNRCPTCRFEIPRRERLQA